MTEVGSVVAAMVDGQPALLFVLQQEGLGSARKVWTLKAEAAAAAEVAARLAVVDKVRAGVLDDVTLSHIAPLFPRWRPGLVVKVGEVYSWDGTLVECIQAHTTQADWTPDVTPALWKVHRTDDGTGPIPWQPGITVGLGEQVVYDGVTYEVLQGHTTQVGWEPPNVPALFVPV